MKLHEDAVKLAQSIVDGKHKGDSSTHWSCAVVLADAVVHEQKLREQIRRESFVQGYVDARDPKTPAQTFRLMTEADEAYAAWRAHR